LKARHFLTACVLLVLQRPFQGVLPCAACKRAPQHEVQDCLAWPLRGAAQAQHGHALHPRADGLITYHRTDGVDLAPERVHQIRDAVAATFSGPRALSPKARVFKSKAKNAQEAHEAIVATQPEGGPRLPGSRPRRQRMLYELIWRRTLACQMADASFRKARWALCDGSVLHILLPHNRARCSSREHLTLTWCRRQLAATLLWSRRWPCTTR
jgi:reverse gyrase